MDVDVFDRPSIDWSIVAAISLGLVATGNLGGSLVWLVSRLEGEQSRGYGFAATLFVTAGVGIASGVVGLLASEKKHVRITAAAALSSGVLALASALVDVSLPRLPVVLAVAPTRRGWALGALLRF